MKAIEKFYKNYPWIIPLFAFAVLVILGGLAHPLWGDEAETAFFAKTILQTGLPKGFDGVNMSSVENAVVLNQDLINHRSPWSQYYLTALSFAIFGQSTFSARLPFILLALLSIILVYYVSLKISGNNKFQALTATVLCSLSVPLLLFSFQDRYYSIVIFSSLVLIITSFSLFTSVKDRKTIWPKIFFILAGVAFAYSQYAVFAVFFTSLFLIHLGLILPIKKLRRTAINFVSQFILFGFIIALIFAPWILILKPGSGNDLKISFSLGTMLETIPFWVSSNLEYVNNNSTFPYIFWLILVLIIGVKIYRRENIRSLIFTAGLILTYTLVFAAFDSTTTRTAIRRDSGDVYMMIMSQTFTSSRYHTFLIPLFLMLASLIAFEIRRFNKLLFYLFLAVYIFTNLFTFSAPRSFIYDYVSEVTNPYLVSDVVVASFLKEGARDGETVFVNSDRAHEALIFLLGEKPIKFVNRVTPANDRIFPKNYSVLPKYLYNFKEDPDWVIKYSTHRRSDSYYDFDMREFAPLGRPDPLDLEKNYSLTILPIFYGEDVTRPEMEWHKFYQITPKYDEQVFIYHKKSSK